MMIRKSICMNLSLQMQTVMIGSGKAMLVKAIGVKPTKF